MIELRIPQRRRDVGGFTSGESCHTPNDVWWGHSFSSITSALSMSHLGSRERWTCDRTQIGLSTLKYLFNGEIMNRASVGSEQPIRPGEVNWMTCGAWHHPVGALRVRPP